MTIGLMTFGLVTILLMIIALMTIGPMAIGQMTSGQIWFNGYTPPPHTKKKCGVDVTTFYNLTEE
jgi:hypothetical protein